MPTTDRDRLARAAGVTPVDAAIVRRKLGHITTVLDLGPLEGYTLEEYLEAIERHLARAGV